MFEQLREVQPGEPITAAWANSLVAYLRLLGNIAVTPPLIMSQGTQGIQLGWQGTTNDVQIVNKTGAELAKGEVCQLGDEVLDEKNNLTMWFEGNAVAQPVWTKFAIAKEIIADDAQGPACVFGACMALVNIQATTDKWAFPVSGDTVLKSGPAGLCELLSPPDGTGEQEMIVCLGRACPDLDGVLDEDCNAGSSATMSVYIGGSDSGENIEVEGTYIPTGQKIASTTRIGTKADNASGVHHIDVSKACPEDQ